MKLIFDKDTDPNQLGTLIEQDIPALTDGYLHCDACPARSRRVSNTGLEPISYDNFMVTYLRGKTRQINHYYPYGLSISSLSYSDEYLYKYTSKELQTGEFGSLALSSGLEMFDFGSRFYDPALGRWFTPDPAEQFANPYLAMGNNPVKYIDPDGEWIGFAIAVGVLIANSVKSGIETKNAGSSFLNGFMYSYGTGAASMALTAGVGAAFGAAGLSISAAGEPLKLTAGQTIFKEVGRSAAHGLVGGTMSHYTGGDFQSGFMASAASSGIGSLTHNLNPVLQVGSSGISGGITSELTGGNFGEGAYQGVLISAVNHLAHTVLQGPTDPPKNSENKRTPYVEYEKPFIPGPYDGPGSNLANIKAFFANVDHFFYGPAGFNRILDLGKIALSNITDIVLWNRMALPPYTPGLENISNPNGNIPPQEFH